MAKPEWWNDGTAEYGGVQPDTGGNDPPDLIMMFENMEAFWRWKPAMTRGSTNDEIVLKPFRVTHTRTGRVALVYGYDALGARQTTASRWGVPSSACVVIQMVKV